MTCKPQLDTKQRVFHQAGLLVRGSYSFERSACSGRMIWRLSPGFFSCKRHSGFSECFGPHDFTLVFYLSPSCLPLHSGFSARMISGLSPTCLHLSPTCLPVHSGCSECFGPHDFALVSHLSPTTLWILCPHDFRLVFHLSPLVAQCTLNALSALVRMILHSSPTTVWIVCPCDFRLVSHLSPTCRPVHSGCSECFGPHDFAPFSQLSPTTLLILCPHHFRLVSHLVSLYTLDALSAVVSHLSSSGRMISHLSPPVSTCLPVHSGWCKMCGPDDFALVPQLSPSTIGTPWILCPHDFGLVSTCLPVHSGCSGCGPPDSRSSQLSPTALSLLCPHGFTLVFDSFLFVPQFNTLWMLWVWVLWFTWMHTCLPLFPHLFPTTPWILCPHDFALASHLHLCLPSFTLYFQLFCHLWIASFWFRVWPAARISDFKLLSFWFGNSNFARSQ